jgi:hypothetical protein
VSRLSSSQNAPGGPPQSRMSRNSSAKSTTVRSSDPHTHVGWKSRQNILVPVRLTTVHGLQRSGSEEIQHITARMPAPLLSTRAATPRGHANPCPLRGSHLRGAKAPRARPPFRSPCRLRGRRRLLDGRRRRLWRQSHPVVSRRGRLVFRRREWPQALSAADTCVATCRLMTAISSA